MSYRGKRVTVMGLGHFGGGVAAARWLAGHGARVTISDRADEAALAEPLTALDGVPIEALHLGAHREDDFRGADLVVVNPAVRPNHPMLAAARAAGVPLTTEIGLLLEAVPAPVVGVTGSNGKSTTAAMIAHLLHRNGRKTWLGGNLGGSLLGSLDEIRGEDWVVVELSSFQLAHLPPQTIMPRIAVVTNCTPNHLDWHSDWGNYVAAKQRMLVRQPPDGRVVLGYGLRDEDGWTRLAGQKQCPLVSEELVGTVGVPGKHNRENSVCAATAAFAAGCELDAVRDGLASFVPLAGRLERIATIDSRDFYNDTTATTPESTVAALGSFDRPVWLLVGGGDKGANFDPLIDVIAINACGAAFYGQMGPRLHALLSQRPTRCESGYFETMQESLAWCFKHSRPGHSIVLSPGCTSHDQFRNFQERGEVFVQLVLALQRRTTTEPRTAEPRP